MCGQWCFPCIGRMRNGFPITFVQAWIDAPLDLTNFDTSKVENMEKMFSGFHGVSIDISSFDFSSVKNSDRMISASEDYPLTVYVKDEAMIEKIKELDPTSSFQYVTFVVKKDQ